VYDIDIFLVNYFVLSFMIWALPLNMPITFLVDRKGLRFAVVTGFSLTVGGICLRCLINYNFVFATIGQSLIAIGNPFFLCSISLLSYNWFGESERLISTGLGSNANVCGITIGYFLP
jgi:FLVCR family feline leukemia virus subgroup C receptor-related protein